MCDVPSMTSRRPARTHPQRRGLGDDEIVRAVEPQVGDARFDLHRALGDTRRPHELGRKRVQPGRAELVLLVPAVRRGMPLGADAEDEHVTSVPH